MKNKINLDGIFSFLLIVVTIYLDYVLFNAKFLPFAWQMIAMALVTIIALLLLTISLKRMRNKALIARRIIVFIFILLFGFASINVDKGRIFTSRITDVKDENIELISVVTKADSSIESLQDLKDKTIYYQTGSDEDNAAYAMDLLEEEVDDITFEGENNYLTLASLLMGEEIEALIISDSYIRSIDDGLEGFEAGIKILTTYERSVTKIDRDHSGTELDLTQDTFTVLISGMDDKGDPNINSRSDVIMVLLVNPKINHVDMISFPRDSFVPNPALGNVNDKLTHTGNDGVENTMSAVEQVLGFDINFYVKVNFTSVVEMVDTLGGINLNVPYAFCEQNSDRSFAQEDLQCLEVGEQTLNGEQALAFARHRKSEGVGDIGRTHAQQQVIAAMVQKLLTPAGAASVPALLDIVPQYVVTNVSDDQLNDFISYELEKLDPWTMDSMTLENGYDMLLTTASLGNTTVYCTLLNRLDLESVWQKYYLMKNPETFNEFTFDINDLTPKNMTSYQVNPNMVLYGDDVSQYLGYEEEVEEETPVQEEETTLPPETTQEPTTTPEQGSEGTTGEETTTPPTSEETGDTPTTDTTTGQ